MRKLSFILLFLTLCSAEVLAEMIVNLQNNFGYTIVNVSEAMGIPDYSEITDEGLVEWDQLNYKGLIQLFFKQSQDVSYGTELGINRLYYWEEKHIPPMSSPRWRWGTIWTGHLGGIIRKSFATHYYVLTGASLHIFFNGSGATVGIPFAIGHDLPISKNFTIPLEFRIDVVFGSAVPIGLGGGAGLKYKFGR
ncbi:hypothetical protein ACFL47_08385 [Candidatus Latescibacterota bacterium]